MRLRAAQAGSRYREYGTCARPGLAEPRLRPPAIAPSSSGAGRIIPGVVDGPSAAPLSQTYGQAGAFQTPPAGPHSGPYGEHREGPFQGRMRGFRRHLKAASRRCGEAHGCGCARGSALRVPGRCASRTSCWRSASDFRRLTKPEGRPDQPILWLAPAFATGPDIRARMLLAPADQFPTPVSRHLPLARRFEAAIVSELRKARSRRVT